MRDTSHSGIHRPTVRRHPLHVGRHRALFPTGCGVEARHRNRSHIYSRQARCRGFASPQYQNAGDLSSFRASRVSLHCICTSIARCDSGGTPIVGYIAAKSTAAASAPAQSAADRVRPSGKTAAALHRVVKMTYSASVSRLGSEFDIFYSRRSVRTEMECCSASCQRWRDWTSTLGRRLPNKLAGVPGATATRRLASLIAELPDEPASNPDPVTIVARLIALLPRPASPADRSCAAPGRRTIPVCMYVIFMVCALGAQCMAASRQPPPPAVNVQALTSTTVSPLVQPPISNQ